jgi:hypothetical protein
MKTFAIVTTLAVSMTTGANALHINGCDPKNIECICHLKKTLKTNSAELLNELYVNVDCNRNDNNQINLHSPITDNNGGNSIDVSDGSNGSYSNSYGSDDSNGDHSDDYSSEANSDDSNGDHSDYKNG